MARVASIVALALVSLVVVLGGFWLNYVYRGATPYDEVGIGLNAALPRPMRAFACRALRERHGNVLPPHGCQDFDFWPARR